MFSNKKTISSVIQFFFIFVLLSGCVSKNSSIPKSTINDNSALSISIDIDSRPSFLSKEKININNIFFIRLDNENDNLKKQKIITSNYKKKSFLSGLQMANANLFCLDIEPGVYAAIAAKGVGANSKVRYCIYFSEKMIKKTIVNLQQNSMIYMGGFDFEDVSYNNQMENPDDIQTYYFERGLIDNVPGKNKPQTISWTRNPQYHSPTLNQVENSKKDELKFLSNILDSFKNTEWHGKIKERLKNLNK